MGAGRTPSQTIGPFFRDALLDRDRSGLVSPDHPSAIEIRGAVYDRAGEVVTDAMVEIWRANPVGHYDDPEDDREDPSPGEGFTGFGRSGTGDGEFPFVTLEPGPIPGPDGHHSDTTGNAIRCNTRRCRERNPA